MINTSIGLIGVAKQTAKGTPASTPTFVHGLTGGQTFKLDRSVEDAPVSCGVRAGTDSYVSSITPGVDFETYGYSDVLPLYFYAAMGDVVTTGSGTYTHTVTLGDTLPYLTFWGRIGSEFTRADSCKVDEIEMEFEGNSPLTFGITAIGMDALFGLASFPGAVTPSCFDGYFVPTGGTFAIDTNSDTPAAAPITAGSMTLANNCTADPLAGQATPGDVEEGKLNVSGSVTVKPSDMELWRKLVTGSSAGTTPTGQMVYGSFEWQFTHSKEPTHTMTVTAEHVAFACDFPSVDPDGGAAELEFTFDNAYVTTAGGTPVTVVFVNETASY